MRIPNPACQAGLLACAVAALFAFGAPSLAQTGYLAEVIHVHDGDSLWVQPLDGGRRQRLRLDGIDAPEICQVDGREARDRLAGMVLRRQVLVEVTGQDRYRRTLARVWLGSEDVQAVLVTEGWAWSYRVRGQPGSYDREEAQARRQGRGLFAVPHAEHPADFRRRHGPCLNE
ncbi:MAG TPA: thermonuclease family protein [Hydrogenophaga sp.]|uniref:thermonuclease family protein n=1 Tax=Hydrogenophaga sp. TaxID=1904254 RepID=UPI002C1068E4|nr:thermonuclease family protein [Hydrogenophaga sp.]HMN93368.1 thermonuclease family protein [Hydrogenophaga sp.]HMN94182.1 thermonuclease family protein [Hydrogenophaga sp.]HMP10786.1 thermonuclease family protein [Hydrogenophaga sp.]